MVSHEVWGYISGVLEWLWALPYLIAILLWKIQPSRTTWFIWSGVSIILFITYYYSWAQETLWQPWVAIGFNMLFALLSLKYWVGGTTKLDLFCFWGSILSLIVWYFTSNPVIALTMIVTIAFIGAIPTMIKTYHNPQSESSLTWFIWTSSSIANILAISTWSFAIAFFPIEVLSMWIIIFLLTLRTKTVS